MFDVEANDIGLEAADAMQVTGTIEQSYCLTPMQQAMLFESLYAEHADIYVRQVVYTLREEIDPVCLQRAWEKVIARHGILRSGIRWEQVPEPLQQVHRNFELPFEVVDWSGLSASEQEERLEALAVSERRAGFDLTSPPLMRLKLIRGGAASYFLIWTFHHLLSDGHSDILVLKEVFGFYEAALLGQEKQLPPAPGYRYFSEWIRSQADNPQAKVFWQQLFQDSGLLARREELAGEGFSNVGSAGFSEITARLPQALTDSLKSLARERELSLNTIIQTAWALLLARHRGTSEVLLGVPRNGRRSAREGLGADAVVGPLVNILPLPVSLSPESSVLEVLQEVRGLWRRMQAHEHTPLHKIQEWIDWTAPQQPFFDSVVVFNRRQINTELQAQGGTWLNRELRNVQNRTSFPLTLVAYGEDPVLLLLRFDVLRLSAEQSAQLLSHFQTLLHSIVANPQQRLRELSLITEDEKRQLLSDWNETEQPLSLDQNARQLFEAQAAATPDALAVSDGTTRLTYVALNARANQLARYLRQRGVKPEAVVGVMLEQSCEAIIACLAVMKADAAYLTLDVATPAARLHDILNGAQSQALITRRAIAARHAIDDETCICLDEIQDDLDNLGTEDLPTEAGPRSLAYVIYTSGSTGQPKGVMIEQRGLLNLIKWHQKSFTLSSSDRASLIANLAFDASVWETWPYLTCGASLHIPADEVRSSSEQLIHWLNENQITVSFLPTPLAEALLELPAAESLGLRLLLTGGDQLHHWATKQSRYQLVNNYGPTENSVVTTSVRVEEREADTQLPPIGRPIANTQVYLLDRFMQPVPVGITGELFVGGHGLARGYLHRPELTAEKFIPNPFSSQPGQRLYRTGDLARYQADGQIEFVGRADQQVKLRGFRIELGEIEAALLRQPLVRDCVVVVRKDTPGQQRLVAYLVLAPELVTGNRQWSAHVQQQLREQLPEYMVPGVMMALERLPLTPNGKVDRRALPAPAVHDAEIAGLARTPLEELIAGVWSEVLKTERVGIDDNFFALGGHSLLATRVVARLRHLLDIELPLRSLFTHPTISQLAPEVEQLRGQSAKTLAPPVQRVERPGALPLSFAQQRLWFLEQLEAGAASSAYQIPLRYRLRGELDTEALERSLQALVARHEALRTSFVNLNGAPQQLINHALHLSLPVTDLSHLVDEQQDAAITQEARQEAQQLFNLEQAPLLRARLLRLSEQEHVLLLTMHHIISDGWSLGVLMGELSTLYTAYHRGAEPQLPELAVQYADYAVWQRDWLQGDVLDSELAYWREQLAGVSTLELPTDHPRPAVQRYRGGEERLELDAHLSEQLRRLSREHGVTLYMTLLAAFQVLLLRYSGQSDIAIGTPVAGRTRRELESIVGCFVNTLVLRSDLSGEQVSFSEVLKRVREVCLGAYAHQEVPFEKLVEELQPERDLSRHPLFQVMFTLAHDGREQLALEGLQVQSATLTSESAKFDLSLVVQERGEELACALRYNAELYEAESGQRMLHHFSQLLGSLTTEPEVNIGRAGMLSDEEREQLISEWNETGREYEGGVCVHELFERQAALTPQAIALVTEQAEVSYEELNERANRVGHYLRARGVGAESVVGLCVERGIEMVVGMLGVLKAGGGYVPLDPQYPVERLEYMLADAGVHVLLSQQRLLDKFETSGLTTISLDTDWKKIAAYSSENILNTATSKNLLYVIYTSGSTGQPKGVAVAHQQIVNYLSGIARKLGSIAGANLAMVSTIAADLGHTVLYPSLCLGGCLHLISEERIFNADSLGDYFRERRIDYLKIVPSHFEALMDSEAPQNLIPRRMLVLGGEASRPALVKEIQSLAPQCAILNHYGPTETTVGVLTYGINQELSTRAARTIPLGRPLANTQVYLLDRFMQPVPTGITGELFVGGHGLARGYLHRPELTAEKFIPDPFSSTEGGRLYRTGDLARYQANGNIEFVGRVDQQVKLRGFRIELGEIEAALRGHEEVRECVAVVREDVPGHQHLVAYVALKRESGVAFETLRGYLKEQLPEHMLPSAIVFLDQLPLTLNGKIDRQKLPAPQTVKPERKGTLALPNSPLQELLVQVWTELLPVTQVGIDDNFFGLGGHSLLATRVVARLRHLLDIELPLRSLFTHPTISQLAPEIARLREQDAPLAVAPPIEPREPTEQTPLSFAQQRLWFLEQMESGSSAYNMPLQYGLRGELDTEALEQSLQALVARHEALRTSFVNLNGAPQQLINHALYISLPLTDLSHLHHEAQEAALTEHVRQEAQQLFNLEQAPLLRARLLRLSEQEHVLLLTMHHIISDGWSLGVLMGELSTLYTAYHRGAEPQLPQLEVQYADYAVWQRDWLQGDVLDSELAYWRTQLSGVSTLELPTDHPRPAIQRYRGGEERLELDAHLSEQLRRLSREHGVTLYMTLLAAFQVLLLRYSGQSDIAIGTPVAGRTRRELESIVGCFVNTLVLRTDLSGEQVSFSEVLKRVREVCLGAYAHQEVPFEKLVEELQPERDLSRHPLFQVMFTLAHDGREQLALEGLQVQSATLTSESAKFDLSLVVQERAGGLGCALRYNAELYEAESGQRMLHHFSQLLGSLTTEPEVNIGRAGMLSDEEREQLISEWNETGREYQSGVCVHELFERQAALTPQAVAVVSEEAEVSYEELNERANRVGHYLRARGVGAESVVGLCVERGVEMVVGMLGVLKAGGGYVPLDAQYPVERLEYMLADAGVHVLLSQQRLLPLLPACEAEVICLDSDWEEIATASGCLEHVGASEENLAYVIYTSGSTGQPKGVAIQHQSAVALMHWAKEDLSADLLDGVLAATSICFDLSVYEIFLPLSWGGRVIIADDVIAASESCRAAEIKLINTVPSAMNALVSSGLLPGSVKRVNLAGEALGRHLVDQVYGVKSVEQVVNLYGPSEDTTYSTVALVESGTQKAPHIGRPIANTQVYLLDRFMQPVPVGITGELFVGGHGLARGYLHRPELTAEKFIPNPFSSQPGQRLYRTGDLARYQANGNIEFVGRADQQVKLRGFRIELGEIEAALLRQPLVRDCVVVVRGAAAQQQLVAYLVLEDEASSRGEHLLAAVRASLREQLPEYMVPGVMMALERLPLTPNGKVDRRSLPEPTVSRTESEETARTPLEELVAGVWVEVLGRARVGIFENFFGLGGHSLLATRVVARLRHLLDIELPLRSLFTHPTISQLAPEIARLREQDAPLAVAPPIEPREQTEPTEQTPLSFAQQRLWFLEQMESGSSAYNMPLQYGLRGELDTEALEQSLQALVARHEALRTSFHSVNGASHQLINEDIKIKIPLLDLSALPPEKQEVEVTALARAQAKQAFDLTQAPLLRTRLLRLSEQEHVLLLTMHHIISDGWSLGVLLKELSALYAAYHTEVEPQLPELEVQYADYAVWQRDWLQGDVLDSELAYWREQLAGVSTLELPTDHPRPAVQRYRGGEERLELGQELSEQLRRLSREHGVTLYMTLLAAFQVLLLRYSGQSDIAIGTPVAGRTRRELEAVVGCFVNTLVLRTDLSGEQVSFSEVLKRVREVCLGAYAHQEVPFEKLVEELQPERDLSRHPLFQVMFTLAHDGREQLRLDGLAVSSRAGTGESAKFDLSLVVQERGEELACALRYNAELYEAESGQRMLHHFSQLLGSLTTEPEINIGRAGMLSDEERAQLVSGWNETAREYEGGVCVHELFERQAALTPQAVAVVSEEEEVSYEELNERANRVGHYLRARGVGAESVVGLCVERGIEMVVGMLGVLKAGGGYVPLDAQYPVERLEYMLADAGVHVLLTQERLVARFNNLTDELDIRLINLDQDSAEIERQSASDVERFVSEENLAYVIYTSGSTGRPKGAMVSHKGVVNCIRWMQETYKLDETDSFLQKTVLNFDPSVWEIFWPLWVGGRVILAKPGGHLDSAYLIETIRRHQVTSVYFVPTMLRAFLEEAQSHSLPSLRRVICGGESLPKELLDQFFAHLTAELHHSYGPTEASIAATEWTCSALSGSSIAPIGRPLGNTQIYLLDAALQPVPVGVAGELYIGGAGVGRGYLRRPALTAERFIPDPFSTEPGQRLYRTGDLARYLPDGNIEFLGRADQQVKLRGYRIELGEIEAALLEHPAVSDCVTVMCAHRDGEQMLVAYVVPEAMDAFPVSDVRRHLKEQLPEYMVPKVLMAIDSLPLNVNGKIDRRQLPSPENLQHEAATSYVGPRNPVEEVLAGIWNEVLRTERVGVYDNFFDLGGHSLLITKIISRIHALLSVDLPITSLFQSPTIADLAHTLMEQESKPGQVNAIAALHLKLDRLSPEEIQALLQQKKALA